MRIDPIRSIAITDMDDLSSLIIRDNIVTIFIIVDRHIIVFIGSFLFATRIFDLTVSFELARPPNLGPW